ncbi:hypothetical protein [Maribacter sp. Asnod1-A12]|uniref:hypothetical protein n=1 Tax=Maribacter sp. Asnod1-A12 TaxID=3160576 RepID=UPI0038639D04
MIRFIGKSLKVMCFGIVPFILLSSGSKGDLINQNLEKGTCSFNIVGISNFHIDGAATFQSKTEKDKFGNTIETFSLSFIAQEGTQHQVIEFIIASESNGSDDVLIGVHKIKNVDRLINSFNGVYGFADLGGESELPFFIKSGDIIITESFSNNVDGKLEVQLVNANGDSLKVKGFFNALVKV